MLRDISLHILDLTQNSTKAGASHVVISLEADEKLLHTSIEDNGCGMTEEFLERVTDPFTTSRTTRKVGMGIPFYKLACEQSGGDFTISSQVGVGTKLSGSMEISSIDRLPLGNLGETMRFLIMGSPKVHFTLHLSSLGKMATCDTKEIQEQLEDVPITEPAILEWIESYINENVVNIFGGVLNEILGGA